MTTWLEMANYSGTYESEVYSIESDYDYYITNIRKDIVKSTGDIRFYVSTTLDYGTTWSEWVDVTNEKWMPFKVGDSLLGAFFRYKIVIDGKVNDPLPIVKSFHVDFNGAISIINVGDYVSRPKIWIKKLNSDGGVELKNTTNNQTIIIENMKRDETIFIDCENEELLTDLPLTYRYDDFNNVYMDLEVGENIITGKGEFEVDFQYEFKLLQG